MRAKVCSSCLLVCLGMASAVHAEEAPATLSVSARLSPEVLSPVNTPSSTVEQTLWARRGKLAVGVQWQGRVQNLRVDGPANALNRNDQANTSLHMGVALDVSERARIELTRPFDQNSVPAIANAAPGAGGMRLSLDVKSSKPMSGLRNGLRLSVTSQGQVTLKPRRGGLAVYYNGSF